MLRHQNVAQEPESQFGAQIAQCLYPTLPEFFRVKEAGTSIRAPGEKMKVVFAVIMLLPGHGAILHHQNAAYIPNCGTYAQPAVRVAK